jgi:hypothetical protein
MNKPKHAIGIRVSTSEYEKVNEIAGLLNTSVTAFITGCLVAGMEMIDADEPSLPQYIAVARLIRHWDGSKEKITK